MSSSSDAVSRLRQLNVVPSQLMVTMQDQSVKTVAIPAVRKRWSHLQGVLSAMAWWQIEAMDKDGGILCVVSNDDVEAAELEDLGVGGREDTKTANLLALMLRAQDVALSRQEKIIKVMLDSNARLLETVSKRLDVMEKHSAVNLDRIQDYAIALAESSADGGESDNQAAELMKAIAPALPALLAKKPNAVPT